MQKTNTKKSYINKTVVDYKSHLNKGTTISVLDFIYNMICICKKFNQKSMIYKVISSLKSLNTKLFSIETITRKFYDIENLKKNYITSNKVSYSYTKILFDTVINRIENDEKEDENYIFKFE